jgi:diphthamide synthase subunit DPH2
VDQLDVGDATRAVAKFARLDARLDLVIDTRHAHRAAVLVHVRQRQRAVVAAGAAQQRLVYKGPEVAVALVDKWLSSRLDEFGVRIDPYTTIEGLRAALAGKEARIWSLERLR